MAAPPPCSVFNPLGKGMAVEDDQVQAAQVTSAKAWSVHQCNISREQ